jgi:hypothetical protein
MTWDRDEHILFRPSDADEQGIARCYATTDNIVGPAIGMSAACTYGEAMREMACASARQRDDHMVNGLSQKQGNQHRLSILLMHKKVN